MNAVAKTAQQLTLDLKHRTALGRDDFLISPANQDAVAWIDRWPNWPAPALIVQGPAAGGKTHLSAVWSERSRAACINPNDLIRIEAGALADYAENLVIDPIDPWIGDREAETTLFHLYNLLLQEKRTILLTMRMAPSQADFALPDLASRLRAAPVASICPPDDSLLAAILVKLFADRQITVSHDVLNYILPRMDRSFSAAHDLVDTADNIALTEKRNLTIPLMRRALMIQQHDKQG